MTAQLYPFLSSLAGKFLQARYTATFTDTLELGGSTSPYDWAKSGVKLYAKDVNGVVTVFGDGRNDAVDAGVFDITKPGGSEFSGDPIEALELQYAGIGVDSLIRQSSALPTPNNAELNRAHEGNATDKLGVDLGSKVVSGTAQLSFFYAGDNGGAPGTAIETAVVRIGTDRNCSGFLDACEVTGTALLRADGTWTESGALDITAASALDTAGHKVAGGNSWSLTDPGLFQFEFRSTCGAFDLIEFSASNGVTRTAGGYQAVTGLDTSDFYLRSMTVSKSFEGLSEGYWKCNTGDWDGFSSKQSFETVFGIDIGMIRQGWSTLNGDYLTLGRALELSGDGKAGLIREAVAALLNAGDEDVNYFYSAAEVVKIVKDAFATRCFDAAAEKLDHQNDLGLASSGWNKSDDCWHH